MKTVLKIFILCAIIINTSMMGFAADSLNLSVYNIKGKFESVSDGLIVIKENGVSKTYIKKDNPFDIYSDYIIYRNSPFSRQLQSGPCKVIFVDTFSVTIKLPNSSSITIPRYRVKDLEINIKN